MESLEPEGHLECMLAERIAIALWKLRRLEQWHQNYSASDEPGFLQPSAAELTPTERWMRKVYNLFPRGKTALLILRYEAHYNRQYIQTLHELEAMQERRKGNATPLTRVDVTGAPGS